uniref:Secreted protein n=1 Tax=Anguilla anguilla TaxID=7936 RepID=A0A0E9X272_ANGAN
MTVCNSHFLCPLFDIIMSICAAAHTLTSPPTPVRDNNEIAAVHPLCSQRCPRAPSRWARSCHAQTARASVQLTVTWHKCALPDSRESRTDTLSLRTVSPSPPLSQLHPSGIFYRTRRRIFPYAALGVFLNSVKNDHLKFRRFRWSGSTSSGSVCSALMQGERRYPLVLAATLLAESPNLL